MKNIKTFIKPLLIFFIIFIILSFLYFSKNLKNKTSNSEPISHILMVGSSSMQEVCEDLAEEFMKIYPNIIVSKSGNGSSEAVMSVKNNVAQIGNLSRKLEQNEKSDDLNVKTIATDGIAVCSNSKNNVKNLSKEDLVKIFTGKITNWKQVGGNDRKIILIGRDFASGTRKSFEEKLGVSNKCKYAVELENNGKVKFKIQNDEDAIGYISFNSLDDTINKIKIDNVMPTYENILNSTYYLYHNLFQISKKNLNDEAVDLWFSFLNSKKAFDIISNNKFLPYFKV